MADGYDRFDNEGSGGGSFVMGLLTGTVLGAGLGMLFAPKAGSELRNQLTEQAGNLANTASEGYRRASESAGSWAEKGREVGRDMYDKARDAVNRGADEAQRYAREAGSPPTVGSAGPGGMPSGSTFGTENIRGAGTTGSTFGSSPESTRGSGSTSGSTPGGGPSGGSQSGGTRRS